MGDLQQTVHEKRAPQPVTQFPAETAALGRRRLSKDRSELSLGSALLVFAWCLIFSCLFVCFLFLSQGLSKQL